jgi:hypothetical protein
MKKSIKVKIVVHPDQLIAKVKQAAEKHGLQFTGDTEKELIMGFEIETGNMPKIALITSWTNSIEL